MDTSLGCRSPRKSRRKSGGFPQQKDELMSNMLRNLPTVNELLDRPPLKSLVRRLSHNVVVNQVGRFLEGMRSGVQSTATALNLPTPADLAQRIADWIASQQRSDLRPVINATGILLHPELGGAPLADDAAQAAAGIAGSYAALDIDLLSGESAPRTKAIEHLLTRLTGAEAATVVNTQAGAAVLALAAVAAGREVLVARGQLVEVPGSHRFTDVIAASGALLREVGAANCTRLEDYAAAISERTAAVLHVHTPHDAAAGESSQPTVAELAATAQRHRLPLLVDLGDGSVIDLSRYGLAGAPIAGDSLQAGADLVLLGGDRLLGGPSCGLVVGRRDILQRMENHPLSSALRPDKLTIAALAATLRCYQDPDLAERHIPLLSLLATPLENLQNRAERLAPQIAASGIVQVEVLPCQAQLSAAHRSQPGIASCGLALTPLQGDIASLAATLRKAKTPVIARNEGQRLLLDLRSVLPRQDVELAAAFAELTPAGQPVGDENGVSAMD